MSNHQCDSRPSANEGIEWGECCDGHHVDRSAFAMRGVTTFVVPGRPDRRRLYMEPVDAGGGDIQGSRERALRAANLIAVKALPVIGGLSASMLKAAEADVCGSGFGGTRVLLRRFGLAQPLT